MIDVADQTNPVSALLRTGIADFDSTRVLCDCFHHVRDLASTQAWLDLLRVFVANCKVHFDSGDSLQKYL